MTIRIGGPKSIVDLLKSNGKAVGPRSKWLGAWTLKSGTADWTTFFNECKSSGQQPLIFWWAWGDDISPTAIKSGVQDRYQDVWKDQSKLLPLLKDVMAKAKAVGVKPIVAIENEFNKNGCDKSPDFAAWFDASADIVKANGGLVLFAPGSWGDLTALCTFYKGQVDRSDLVGLQCGYFKPRRSDDLALVGGVMARNFAKLPPGKPRILYDVFLSCYGGNYATTHPFAGGDGRALEGKQAQALKGLAAIPDLVALMHREVKDNPNFDVKNYGGYAERFTGIARADGSRKPSYDALLAVAEPAGATPDPEPAPDPCQSLRDELGRLKADLAFLRTGFDSQRVELGKMTAERDALQAKLESIRAILDTA